MLLQFHRQVAVCLSPSCARRTQGEEGVLQGASRRTVGTQRRLKKRRGECVVCAGLRLLLVCPLELDGPAEAGSTTSTPRLQLTSINSAISLFSLHPYMSARCTKLSTHGFELAEEDVEARAIVWRPERVVERRGESDGRHGGRGTRYFCAAKDVVVSESGTR